MRTLHLFFLLVSIIINIVFCGLYLNVNWGGDLSWTRKAAEEAENVASIACSGHGRAFLDGLVDDGNRPVCECYGCYSGPDCSVLSLPCVADVDSGNPIFLEPYWMSQEEESGVMISGWHRLGYAYDPPNNGIMSMQLENYIRKLHELVGNAVTQGKYLVFGTGTTQLLNAAIHALSFNSSKAHVVASIPFYSMYKEQTDLLQTSAYEFKGDTSLWKTKTNNTNSSFIEFVTSPNNPDGKLRDNILKGPTVKTIYDRVYYWPHYSAIPAPANEDLMLFSASKLTGHAGSRFGWAVVKDKDVQQKMISYVKHTTLGISHDSQLRVYKLLKTIVDKNGGREIFEYAHQIMETRWKSIEAIMSTSSRYSIQQIPPQFCTFYQRVRGPSPAYAWLRCERQEDENCYEVLKSNGIIGREGWLFGAGYKYVRLSLIKSEDNFNLLLHNLKILVSAELQSDSSESNLNAY